MSSAEIQKSAAGVTFSNTSLLLTLQCCEVKWRKWCAFHITSSSSRMRAMNCNWSATKQRLHLQSVAEISRRSVLSGDRIRQCETSSESRHKDTVSRHLLVQALQCPCSVRKWFSRVHCCRGRSKPSCRIVGSHTRWELTTWANFQLCLHRLLMSTGCKSSYSGFLDVSRSNGWLRISGSIGQLSCLTIFSTSLSVAAFFRRAGGSMLESTGSHGRGVERRVPEMRRVVEFNCTSTWLVWAERDQTVVQYSAAESQCARADDCRVLALAPQVEPASFINKLFRFFSLPAVFVKCSQSATELVQTFD